MTKCFVYAIVQYDGDDPFKIASSKLMDSEELAINSFLKGFRKWANEESTYPMERILEIFPDNITFDKLQDSIGGLCTEKIPRVFMEKFEE